MKRAIVIGCPGSGKSTFSRKLHQITGLPLVHLDLLFWNADGTTADPSVFRQRLTDVLRQEAWILDGNYGSTMEERLRAGDTVFFLDYPVELCLAGIRERRGKERADLPWVEREEDAEFLAFVRAFPTQSRPKILELLDRYPDKTRYLFQSREQAEEFLRSSLAGEN